MFKIKLITQKLVLSQKIIKNKLKNIVLFEKYEPKKYTISSGTFSAITGSAIYGSSILTINASNRTIIGSNTSSMGGYDISGKKDFILLASRKPNSFQRMMINLIFGWKWLNKNEL